MRKVIAVVGAAWLIIAAVGFYGVVRKTMDGVPLDWAGVSCVAVGLLIIWVNCFSELVKFCMKVKS